MKNSSFSLLLITSFLLFSLLQTPTSAIKKSYIVYLGSHSHGSEPTLADFETATESHHSFLQSFLESDEKAEDAIFYSYNRHINGFAAILDEEKAAEISQHPDVLSVFPNQARKLHTTRSWDFLGVERNGKTPLKSIWNVARFGEDSIIANLDTGVWPESESFNDEGLGPIPSKWKGICENNTKTGVPCNRKLIGARYFNKGYAADGGIINSTNDSARDEEGHGSHTLSTAGGSFVPNANVFGYGNGTAKGGSPKARVAAYKVCWPPTGHASGSCYDADIIAGFDAAISDGVDVISVSLGGGTNDYFEDGIAIASFHAVQKGIVVICSAGNSGPDDGSVTNVAPWIITVGASTIDRDFSSYVGLGNKHHIKGVSLSSTALPTQKFYPLINGADAHALGVSPLEARLCMPETLNPEKVKGKIVVCLRGETARVDKGLQTKLAGAVGMILANDITSGDSLVADAHVLPATHVTYADGQAIYAYINSTKAPTAYITRPKTEYGKSPSPVMADFSSKGPNPVTPEILKPDITAPGVNIIAAFTEASAPTGIHSDTRRIPFNTESGTSMSCPHVAGIVGLLKTLYPHWSPSAIKSAIMTTARTRDSLKEPILNATQDKATPFSYGAGHIWPNRAMNPGLVYDITVNDYLNFLCSLGYSETQLQLFSEQPYKCHNSASVLDFNYPSITVPSLYGSVTVKRTLKNVDSPGTYKSKIKAPKGVSVSIKPDTLTFNEVGEEKSFELTLKAERTGLDYQYGSLVWSDGLHNLRTPIVVRAR